MTNNAANFTHIVNSLGQPLCCHDKHPEYEWPDVLPMSGCPYCREKIDNDHARHVRNLEQECNQKRNNLEEEVYDKLANFAQRIHDNQVSYFDRLNQIDLDKRHTAWGKDEA